MVEKEHPTPTRLPEQRFEEVQAILEQESEQLSAYYEKLRPNQQETLTKILAGHAQQTLTPTFRNLAPKVVNMFKRDLPQFGLALYRHRDNKEKTVSVALDVPGNDDFYTAPKTPDYEIDDASRRLHVPTYPPRPVMWNAERYPDGTFQEYKKARVDRLRASTTSLILAQTNLSGDIYESVFEGDMTRDFSDLARITGDPDVLNLPMEKQKVFMKKLSHHGVHYFWARAQNNIPPAHELETSILSKISLLIAEGVTEEAFHETIDAFFNDEPPQQPLLQKRSARGAANPQNLRRKRKRALQATKVT